VRLGILLVLFGAVAPLATGGASKIPPSPTQAAVVPTGSAPCGIAAHDGSIWVAAYEAGVLLRLDAQGRLTRRIRVGRSACRVAVARDAVWVTRDRASELVRVDLRTGRVRRIAVAREPFDVMLAAGSLWVTSHAKGTVSRLDPDTGRLHARIAVGGSPAGLAWCGGRVWVGHGGRATWVSSIDPSTLEARHDDVIAARPGWPDCIRGSLWVTTPDSVLRLGVRTGRLVSALPLGATLAHAAAAPDGTVWVTDKQRSVVHRVTVDGRYALDTFAAGPGAFALARAGSAMWITSFAGSDVRSYRPR
jgi:virginiamycin B lyase